MVRKFEDQLKRKVDGDEIDSVNTLINELYDRLVEIERRGVMSNGEMISPNSTPSDQQRLIQLSVRSATMPFRDN